jgi:Peptidyl-prolyl cis-trans isomerase (rotamase) - cyclophilin family
MRKFFSGLSAIGLTISVATAPSVAEEAPSPALAEPATPNEVIAAAPASDWLRIVPADLVVMNLAPDPEGKARQVVIQLITAPFSQGWSNNIRKLVASRWYDGIAVVRVQDNYVVQWGDPDGEAPDKAKPLPAGLREVPESEYTARLGRPLPDAATPPTINPLDPVVVHKEFARNDERARITALSPRKDAYAAGTGVMLGWPVAFDQASGEDDHTPSSAARIWPVHCYGMVGVGRNLSPDTGTGAELYVVIGQAPRQLDRNIALVGRVIAGIEHLSSLPRGTGELGFYETPQERTPIVSVRMGNEVAGLPAYEYLATDSASFAAYANKRANRKDDFYIQPAGGVDVCNVPVPVREVGAALKRAGM